MSIRTKIAISCLAAVLLGVNAQSFAVPMSIVAEGTVTDYSYSTADDPFGGSVNTGDAFWSMVVLDPDTALDYYFTNTSVGRFNWTGDVFHTNALVDGINWRAGDTNLTIYNDMVEGTLVYDSYRIDNWAVSDNERMLFSILLRDDTARAFDSDGFVLEPDLEMFGTAIFLIHSWDNDNNLNYAVTGDLTLLIDPPGLVVPEPGTVFLLGFGLVGVFFAGRRKITPKAGYAV